MKTYKLVLFLGIICILQGSRMQANPISVPQTYTFTLDGEVIRPITISLDGDDDLKPGDLLVINDLYIVLDEPQMYALEDKLEEDGCIYLLNSDGIKSVLGAKIETVYDSVPRHDPNVNPFKVETNSSDPIDPNLPGMGLPNMEISSRFINPLSKLSREAIRKIRGIKIEEWDRNIATQLNQINPKRTCVTISTSEEETCKVLSSLPKRLQYLSLDYLVEADLGKLSIYKKLKFLELGTSACEIDVMCLKDNINLQYLWLSQYDPQPKLVNLDIIRNLKSLYVLRMPNAKNLKNIDFVTSSEALAYLDISDTNVVDLSRLGCLKNLREVRANRSQVSILPKGDLPHLEKIWAMGTKLSLETVEDFESDHAGCTVAYKWNRSLPKLLADATKVEAGDFTFPTQSHVYFADVNAASVQGLIKHLQTDPCEMDAGTLCSADFCLAFYNGNKPLEMFEIVCSGNIRWQKGSPYEVMLTKSSGDYLAQWLAKHGFSFMLEQRKKQAEEYKIASEQSHNEFQAFLTYLPDQLSRAILTKYESKNAERKARRENMTFDIIGLVEGQELPDLITSTIKTEIPDDQNRANLCFRILANDTNSLGYYPNMIGGILRDIPQKAKQDAARNLLSDPNAVKGISKWLINMYGWEQVDSCFLESVLPNVISVALANPDRMKTISSLGQIKSETSKRILRHILKGEIILPQEKQQPYHRQSQYYPQFSYAALAASALAQQGDVNSLPLIIDLSKTANKDDKRMFQMAADRLREIISPATSDSNMPTGNRMVVPGMVMPEQ